MACLREPRKSRSDSIGSYDAYRELPVLSSVDLLRASIVRSIRERAYENQGFLERKFDGSDNRSAQFCGPKYSLVEVSSSYSDAESDVSDSERIDTSNENKSHLTQRTNSYEGDVTLINSSEEPEDSFSINSDESESNILSSTKETQEDVIQDNREDSTDQKSSTEMNNFILARRKLGNSIFQDCSTYDITCPTVPLNEVNDKCAQPSDSQKLSEDTHLLSSTNSITVCSKEDISPFCLNENNPVTQQKLNANEQGDDHTSLCDTFFTHVVGDEQVKPNATFHHERCVKSVSSSSVERDLNSVESTESEVVNNSEQSALPAKRKFSRRHRKRSRRKAKSKKSYVYECSKCGVSYFIPTKAMNKVACCLHCDLWTPVEPTFVKAEKPTWNTCRVS